MSKQKPISTSRTAIKVGIPLGLIMGAVFIFITFSALNISILNWVLVALGVVQSIKKHKTLKNNQISFWESFGVGSLTAAVSSVIAGLLLLGSLILYAIIYQNSRRILNPSQLFFQMSIFLTFLGVLVAFLYSRLIQKL